MSLTVVVFRGSSYIHPAFRKFRMHCYAISLVSNSKSDHIDLMLERLQPYGILYEEEGVWSIKWTDEAHWSWFLLRWS